MAAKDAGIAGRVLQDHTLLSDLAAQWRIRPADLLKAAALGEILCDTLIHDPARLMLKHLPNNVRYYGETNFLEPRPQSPPRWMQVDPVAIHQAFAANRDVLTNDFVLGYTHQDTLRVDMLFVTRTEAERFEVNGLKKWNPKWAFDHASDYSWAAKGAERFELTTNQALILGVLHRDYLSGGSGMLQATAMVRAGLKGNFRDSFRGKAEAVRTALIAAGKNKGWIRLNLKPR